MVYRIEEIAPSFTRASWAFDYAGVDELHGIAGLLPTSFVKSKELVYTTTADDFINELKETHRDVWSQYVDHAFPRDLASGTASLEGFRHYMIQDKIYIENYVTVRMQSVARSSFADVREFASRLPNSIKYSDQMRTVCVQELGIASEVVDNEPLSEQLQNSVDFYEKVARDDDWFSMHIALLPCILGYFEICSKIIASQATVRNTLYYLLWVLSNADPSSVEKYKGVINKRLTEHPPSDDEKKKWGELFATACTLEKNFFDIAKDAKPYTVVGTGKYRIRIFGSATYLQRSQDGSVVSTPQKGGESQEWVLELGSRGYSVQHNTSKKYLGSSGGKVVCRDDTATTWSIVPVTSMKNTYQLLLASNINLALGNKGLDIKSLLEAPNALDIDLASKDLDKPGSIGLPVFVENNYRGSSQLVQFQVV